jgi:hypothetical protein
MACWEDAEALITLHTSEAEAEAEKAEYEATNEAECDYYAIRIHYIDN